MTEISLDMQQISKQYQGVKALTDVSLSITQGEIHGLCGENGAGKSTLMNILSGVIPVGQFTGQLFWHGQPCQFKQIKDSEAQGIVIIHQELALIPELSIMENIFLGNEIANKGVIDWGATRQQAQFLMTKVGLKAQPETLISQLGVGQQQLVEIAKALSKDVSLLILDEPTAALNEEESQQLLRLLKEFQQGGLTSIIISHKLSEIMSVVNRVTILRDGRLIETIPNRPDLLSEQRLIKGMVGRELANRYPHFTPTIGPVLFEVTNWTVSHPQNKQRQVIQDLSFYIKAGEIIGIAGLMGAGRTELALSLFGRSYGSYQAGKAYKKGQLLKLSTVKQAIQAGLAYVTEDRKGNGLILPASINQNISLASLKQLATYTVINQGQEVAVAQKYQEQLRIKTPDVHQSVASLSGGNQQKVMLAKWLLTQPDVLFLDEPTRGIDVGAKYEIYQLIQTLALAGKAICFISSELPELLGMCQRIYTMNSGQLTAEFLGPGTTQEELLQQMTRQVVAYGT